MKRLLLVFTVFFSFSWIVLANDSAYVNSNIPFKSQNNNLVGYISTCTNQLIISQSILTNGNNQNSGSSGSFGPIYPMSYLNFTGYNNMSFSIGSQILAFNLAYSSSGSGSGLSISNITGGGAFNETYNGYNIIELNAPFFIQNNLYAYIVPTGVYNSTTNSCDSFPLLPNGILNWANLGPEWNSGGIPPFTILITGQSLIPQSQSSTLTSSIPFQSNTQNLLGFVSTLNNIGLISLSQPSGSIMPNDVTVGDMCYQNCGNPNEVDFNYQNPIKLYMSYSFYNGKSVLTCTTSSGYELNIEVVNGVKILSLSSSSGVQFNRYIYIIPTGVYTLATNSCTSYPLLPNGILNWGSATGQWCLEGIPPFTVLVTNKTL